MTTSTSTRLFASLLILMLLAAVAASAQITPSDDAYTFTTAPATNYGTNGALQLQSGKATVFVRFDLSSIPPGYTDADIAKATLKLYVNTVATPGSFNINYVVASWSETTVTATLEPAIGTTIASNVNVTTANKTQYILIDVTAALGAWLDGSQTNDGIALVANSPLNVTFTSKENTAASHPPELDIVFTGAGPRGPQGFAGATGPTGTQGVQGPIGPTGVAGAPGPTGKTGAAGGRGPVGLTGPQGATGATGTQGPIGLTGAQGPQGPQGTAGTNGTGFKFRNAFDPAASYTVNDVVTYSGSTYVAIAASNGPNNHTPDTNPSAWTPMAQQGAAGATGSQGPAGATGPQGLIGLTGATGAQGPVGATGSQGLTGLTGATGTQGPAGPQGATGATGTQGPIGFTGAQGPQGPQGTAGTNGTGFNFTGPFNNSTSYNINDVATYNGSTYVATLANQGSGTPDTNPTDWTLMAQQGAAGATGSQGPTGTQGPQGPIGLTGANGTQGPAGVAGPQGATGATGTQGPIGFTGAQGTPGTNGTGFNWKGSWNAATSYNVNDVATFNGTSYVATQSNVNNEPDLSVGSSNDNITVTFTCNPVVPSWGMYPDCSTIPGAVVGGMNSLTYSVPSNPQNSPNNGESFFLEQLSGFINGTPVNLELTYNDMTIHPFNGSLTIYMHRPGQGYPFTPVVLVGAGCQYTQSPYNGCTSSSSFWTGTVTNATLETGNIPVVGDVIFGVTGSSPVTYVVQPTNSWNIMAQSGAAGAQGAAGAIGAQGPAGATGTQGLIGLTGANGTQGIQGIQGATGPQGAIGPQGPAGNTPGHIALLQWWSSLTYPVGIVPQGVAFDGTNIWVANYHSVTKLLASTGAVVGNYTVGGGMNSTSTGVAFDGTNIWVTSGKIGDTVTEFLASTGAVVGTYTVVSKESTWGVAFDGTNIWVTNGVSGTVTELLASTGAVVGTYAVGSFPYAVAFDGTNIWVTNSGSNTVTELLASTGAVVGTYPVGGIPRGVAFDGTNIWVANEGSNSVTKLLASTGAEVGTYPVGSPFGVAFDGTNIWVTNSGSNTVTKLVASTGTLVGTYSVGIAPQGVAFDGANIWVTNSGSNTVSKIPAF